MLDLDAVISTVVAPKNECQRSGPPGFRHLRPMIPDRAGLSYLLDIDNGQNGFLFQES
jgi:hypothetical protein